MGQKRGRLVGRLSPQLNAEMVALRAEMKAEDERRERVDKDFEGRRMEFWRKIEAELGLTKEDNHSLDDEGNVYMAEECDCPSCQMRKMLEKMTGKAIDLGDGVKVGVIDPGGFLKGKQAEPKGDNVLPFQKPGSNRRDH